MKKLLFAGIFFGFLCRVSAQDIRIRNVNLVDVEKGKIISGQDVIFNNRQIEYVGLATGASRNSTVIDGTGKYLMPGLIDAHIHFFQSGGLYTRPDAVDLRNKVPYEKEWAFTVKNVADYMHRYLRLGITTVADVGGPFFNFVVRDSIAATTEAPNVWVTGPLFSMIENDFFGPDKPIVKVATNAQADSLFYKMLAYKPDFIKIWYIAGRNHPPEHNFSLVKHIAGLSHKHNLRLAVHATELKTAQFAVDAGADILVHSIDDEIIPEEFIKILRDKKVTVIPTMIVGNNYYKTFSGLLDNHSQDLQWANPFVYGTLTDPEAMDSVTMPRILRFLRKTGIPNSEKRADSIMAVNLVKMVRGNVNIATGTDAGNIGTMHGSSYLQEMESMKKAGMSLTEILKASTINAAQGFGKDKTLGTIEKGKMADMVLLNKNPLESLQHLTSIQAVFKNGRSLILDSLIQETPEALVQRQLNAYNARNIDAFMDTYADSINLLDFDGKRISAGKVQMRQMYESWFKQVPNLYCEIISRIVIGNKVIDHEKVRAGNQTFQAVAIYEIDNKKISRVTFLR